MDLEGLQGRLRQFAAERDWQVFHTPKNLAMALMVEAAELAELFQWLTPEQSKAARSEVLLQRRVGDELADVLLYLLQLADHTGVDLDRAVAAKLQKNARKHPPLRPGQPAAALALPPRQTHVLLDYENVQPDDEALRALVPAVTDLWLFHGPHQTRVATLFTSFGDRVTRVPISRSGKNSLDFHLSFYVGYIAATHPDARLVVLANDQGYAPMLEHAQTLGFEAALVGHARARRPAARTVARKAPALATPAARAKPVARAKPAAPAKPAATAKPVALVAGVAGAPVPAKKTRAASAKPAVATTGSAAAPAAAKPPRARPPSRRASAAKPAATETPATARTPKAASAGAKPARQAAPAPTHRTPAAKVSSRATTPSTAKAPAQAATRSPALTLERLARQLRQQKGSELPKKVARLQSLLKSLLGPQADAAAAQAALAGLQAAGLLSVDGQGAVTYTLSPAAR